MRSRLYPQTVINLLNWRHRAPTPYWVLGYWWSHHPICSPSISCQLPAAGCRHSLLCALYSVLLSSSAVSSSTTTRRPVSDPLKHPLPFLDDLLIRLVHYLDYRWKVLRLASCTKFIGPPEPCSSPQTNVRATKTSFWLCSLLYSLRISTVFRPAKQFAGALCVPSFVQVTALGTRLHQLHLPTIPSIPASGLDFHSPCKKVIVILCCNTHKAPMHNDLTASLYPHQWR